MMLRYDVLSCQSAVVAESVSEEHPIPRFIARPTSRISSEPRLDTG